MTASRITFGDRARTYRGRRICADSDLHERALDLLREHVAPGAAIADVGCGRGAFCLRLADAGYRVTGLDVEDSPEHEAGDYGFDQVDLLDPAARAAYLDEHGGTRDAVVLLEVIEHVRNPWEVLEFCRGLLREGGTLLLSTPNLTSYFSRFRFLTGGVFHQFEPADLTYGHINPMTPLMVATVLDEEAFDLVVKTPGPPMPVLVWDRNVATLAGRVLHCVSYLVAAALTPLMRGGDLDGWSTFYVARRRG